MAGHQNILRGYGLPVPGTSRVMASRPLKVPALRRRMGAPQGEQPAGIQPIQPTPGRPGAPAPQPNTPQPNTPQPTTAPPEAEPNYKVSRSPKSVKVHETNDPRRIMALIQGYAGGRRTVILNYTRATDGRQVVREVEPYSIRVRTSRTRGTQRYFYGFCLYHQEIHSFLISNITSVRGSPRKYVPRWRVEL
jgi:hypothetical protein